MRPPFKVRASSWGQLFSCAHAWEGVHLLGMKMPSSPRALLGTGIHHGTAVFDTARIIGTSVSASDAVEQAVEKIVRPEQEVSWAGSDLTVHQMQVIAAQLVTMYCTKISPQYEFAAVELTTTPFVIDCGGGVQIELTGTLDRTRLRRETNGYGISDVKSGAAAVADGRAKTKGHVAQLGTYEILYQHTTGNVITEPAGIIGLKTRGKPEVGEAEVVGAKEIMLGTPDEPGLIGYAASMFRTGMFPPNPQSVLCSAKYCSRHRVCKFKDQS